MAKAKKDADQYRRFKEAVKEYGADETGDALDRALKKMIPPVKTKKTSR